MKRCPECRRDYYDDSLLYCLDDGNALLDGPATADGPQTAILHDQLSEEQSSTLLFLSHPPADDDDSFKVAVVPIKHTGSDTGVGEFAEGLSKEIVKGLTLFSYLKASSSGSDKTAARYVVEGNVRQSGPRLRLSVQLTDSEEDENLWAENYDFTFEPEAVFELQDKLAARIVSTVADVHGILPTLMGERLRKRPVEGLTPYQALVRSFNYFHLVTPSEWRTTLDGVEAALAKAPDYATLRAMRALLLVQGYAQGFDKAEATLDLGTSEARRAVEAGPSDHLAWFALAQALFFKKEFESFPNAVRRSLALNPLDGNAIALFGEMVSYSGDWTWGLELAQTARDLNPHYPGWYWHANFNDAYRRREYKEALEIALKMNLNSNWGAHVLTAVTYGQLGKPDLALRSWNQALSVRPDLIRSVPRDVQVWFDDEHANHLKEGLRKAGIRIEDT